MYVVSSKLASIYVKRARDFFNDQVLMMYYMYMPTSACAPRVMHHGAIHWIQVLMWLLCVYIEYLLCTCIYMWVTGQDPLYMFYIHIILITIYSDLHDINFYFAHV